MARARRTAAIVASLAVLAAAPRHPAAAHFCASPVQVDVGKEASVTIGVAAEEKAVTRIDVHVPDGFTLASVVDAAGWANEVGAAQDLVSFTGGSIPPFGCAYFTVAGTATRKAALAFPLDVHTEDGAMREYRNRDLGAQYAAQLVYAGVDPPQERVAEEDDGGGSSTGRTIVTTAIAAVVVAAGAWGLRVALAKASPPPRPRPTPKKRAKKRR